MALAVIPTWAAPADQAIRDAHRIAAAIGQTNPHPTVRAVAATLGWITGCQRSPLTHRPVTGAIPVGQVRGELLLANVVAYGDTELDTGIWADVGAAPAPSHTVDPDWATGVASTVAWLLGRPGAECPVPLPARRPDGEVCSAEDLYRERLRKLGPHPVHERKREEWHAAREDAARSARLAELAASV